MKELEKNGEVNPKADGPYAIGCGGKLRACCTVGDNCPATVYRYLDGRLVYPGTCCAP